MGMGKGPTERDQFVDGLVNCVWEWQGGRGKQ